MRRLVASIPPIAEFCIVVGLAFGAFIFAEVFSLFHPHQGAHHNNVSLLILAIYEIALAIPLIAFLVMRGWTWQSFGLTGASPLADAGGALLLLFVTYLAWFVIWNLTARLSPQTAQTMVGISKNVIGPHIPPATSIFTAIVNGAFEELFVTGYVISALRREKKSLLFSVNASTAIRLAYHLYQGPLGVLSIIPTGLIFGSWYARTNRLWPLIFAHILLDMIALFTYGR